ncbi:protein of unknown function [Candidatus Hydrogenisulfobacillus filiaventi]|uniref:Uncharacterized protein n=1 Tax=Candidatus Hydrogenisulfobacillus filiaventi TaxID=2707344 RepID=A0A6F8ZD69_9FIRM|nr:hypothetical protein [Bacillota bacterium]CAB1127583.1 protein of unknown function [Candidatus Hydrogenisulfobacillus filiaventi]
MRKPAATALGAERRRLIARYQALKAARIPLPGDGEDAYRRQLIAFHVGVFQGLLTASRSTEDLKLAEAQLDLLEQLVPYYDQSISGGA